MASELSDLLPPMGDLPAPRGAVGVADHLFVLPTTRTHSIRHRERPEGHIDRRRIPD